MESDSEPQHGDLTTVYHTLRMAIVHGKPYNTIGTARLAASCKVDVEDAFMLRSQLIQQFKEKALLAISE